MIFIPLCNINILLNFSIPVHSIQVTGNTVPFRVAQKSMAGKAISKRLEAQKSFLFAWSD